MTSERFKELLDELDGNSLQTLKEKNTRYAKNGDCLHNFRSGAEIMGCTPAQACWRYMAKHLADLRNKIDANDFSDREDWLEKCQDAINYFRFLWCIANDNGSMYMPEPEVEYIDVDELEKKFGNLELFAKLPKPECKHADYDRHPYGERVCSGPHDNHICFSYENCSEYEANTNNKKGE